jgi:MFS family permease
MLTKVLPSAAVICAAISSFFPGKIGDRYGHKDAMLLAYWGNLITDFITILSWNIFSVYLVFTAVGIGQGAFMPSAMNLIYDFLLKRDVKTYMAIVDSILAPFILFYIVLIGWLVTNGNYELSLKILIGSLMIGILSLVYLVDDPRKEKFM